MWSCVALRKVDQLIPLHIIYEASTPIGNATEKSLTLWISTLVIFALILLYSVEQHASYPQLFGSVKTKLSIFESTLAKDNVKFSILNGLTTNQPSGSTRHVHSAWLNLKSTQQLGSLTPFDLSPGSLTPLGRGRQLFCLTWKERQWNAFSNFYFLQLSKIVLPVLPMCLQCMHIYTFTENDTPRAIIACPVHNSCTLIQRALVWVPRVYKDIL